MEINDVIDMLLFFRDIEKEIKFCRRIIEDFETRYYSVDGIVKYDEPVVQEGATSDPTTRLALNLPDSVAPSCRQLEDYINELAVLKGTIFAELQRLPYIQMAVIYHFYVEEMPWKHIVEREHYGRETCKRNRTRGLEKLRGFFQANAVIKNFFVRLKS